MPAKTERQRRFFGAELARRRAGKKSKVKMSTEEVRKMATKKRKAKRKVAKGANPLTRVKDYAPKKKRKRPTPKRGPQSRGMTVRG